MKSTLKLCVLLFSCYLVGCSANASDRPDASRVRVVSKGVPVGCHFRGNVVASRKDINGGPSRAMTQDQINDLRGQAASLGGNLVLLTGESSHYYDEYFIATEKVSSELEAQSVQGRAYWCPGRG